MKIKRVISIIIVGFLLLSTGMIQVNSINFEKKFDQNFSNKSRTLAISPWPCFHNGVRHTGLSIYNTSNNPGTLKWKYQTGIIYSSPIIGEDGTIYIGTKQGRLIAINQNGTSKWKFKTDGRIDSTPVIDANNTIYFGSRDNNLYALNSDGELKWKFTTGDSISASPVIDSNGTIYIGSHDKYLYAVNSNGTEKWKFRTGAGITCSPAIGTDGIIYFGSDHIYALYPNGTKNWYYYIVGNYGMDASPAIDDNGIIYFGTNHGKFYALNPSGTLEWQSGFGSTDSSPAISSDGTIYKGTENGYLYAIKSNGDVKWKLNIGGDLESSPAIGAEGTVYIGSSNKYLYAIYPNGSGKWRFETDSHITSSPAIGSNGTIYVGSQDLFLYAIGKGKNNRPTPPEDFKAKSGIDYFNLSWNPPIDNGGANITKYKIYKGIIYGDEVLLQILDPTITSFQDRGVKKGIIYYYYIVASSEFGESQPSRITAILKELPTQPQNLTAIPGNKYILLTWQPPFYNGGLPIIKYNIYRRTISGNESFLISVSGNITIFNNTLLMNNQTYYFKIRAINEVGEGPFSNEVNATTIDIHYDENNDLNNSKDENNDSNNKEQRVFLSIELIILLVIIIFLILISMILYFIKTKK